MGTEDDGETQDTATRPTAAATKQSSSSSSSSSGWEPDRRKHDETFLRSVQYTGRLRCTQCEKKLSAAFLFCACGSPYCKACIDPLAHVCARLRAQQPSSSAP